jgi:hypothetical protein
MDGKSGQNIVKKCRSSDSRRMKLSLVAALLLSSHFYRAIYKVIALPVPPRTTNTTLYRENTNDFQPEHHINMLSDNASSPLPDKGADDDIGGPEPLLIMDNSQHTEVGLLNICSPGPQTRCQPTTARDENKAKNTSPQSKQQSSDSAKSVVFQGGIRLHCQPSALSPRTMLWLPCS